MVKNFNIRFSGTDIPIFFASATGLIALGGQMYIDQMAPTGLEVQAQGFIFFVTFGLGLLAGNFISGQVIEHFSEMKEVIHTYDWNNIWFVTSAAAMAILIGLIFLLKSERNPRKLTIDKKKYQIIMSWTNIKNIAVVDSLLFPL